MENWYVLMYPTGLLVGVDTMSGGYPYSTRSLAAARLWPCEQDAREYMEHFKEYNMVLCKVCCTLEIA